MKSKICQNTTCKKEFLSKSTNSKYCSISCRDNVYFKNKQDKLKLGIEGL